MENRNERLEAIYNGNEVITASGYTMKSNYIVPMLSRMIDEGLINNAGSTVVQVILQYKHTEENPFPSREEIARLLGKTVSYVKKALKSIKDTGILAIEKAGRKNTYSFKPFFTLLESFIVEYKQKQNYEVKIAELLNVDIQKEEHDFSWSENYQSEKEDASEEEVKDVAPTLPEELSTVAEAYEIDSEGMDAIRKAYTAYSKELDIKVFVEKIALSVGKSNFTNYFNKCILSAYTNNEQTKQETKQKPNYYKNYTPKNGEIVPNWFDKHKAEQQAKAEEKRKQREEELAKVTPEQLEQEKQEIAELLAKYTNNNKVV